MPIFFTPLRILLLINYQILGYNVFLNCRDGI
jgi:hypothetical protein